MNYILKGHNLADDVMSMLMMFYPNDKYVLTEIPKEGITVESRLESLNAYSVVYIDNKQVAQASVQGRDNNIKEIKRIIKLSLYNVLQQVKPMKMPWGILTGVRPAKVVSAFIDEGMTRQQTYDCLKNDYLVSDDKISLAMQVSESERQIVENGKDKIGMYIGIPFCPTRCLYCSFTAYPLSQYAKRVDEYLDCLIKEMEFMSDYVNSNNLESLYIGGGTPTSLNEQQLDRMLTAVDKYFNIPVEYTVEAGRPDTITRQKLQILKKHNVNRISINPQTLNDETLKRIGRKHSVEMFKEAFNMARQEGHTHINTDIIIGLPGEGVKELEQTMKGLRELSPESITVHTLAVKRASRLKETLEEYTMADYDEIEKMLELSAEYTRAMGMEPYYMYRQKNMLGNFENVGYCKPHCQCIYNVQIMEEKQTIIALGAGGSTKLYNSKTNELERIFNVKSIEDYTGRIDEMLERKDVLNKK